ncbi:MAG: hypothetical protein ACTHOO_04950 [Alcanivorax sp.]
MQTLSEYIDIFIRLSAVYVLLFLFFILNIISISTPVAMAMDIPFIVMVFYYWSIYRPTLIPPVLVFIIGICYDLLSGWPVGLNALILLTLRHNVSSQRLFMTGQQFIVVWLGYTFVSAVALFLQWGCFGLLRLNWSAVEPILTSWTFGVFLFPVVSVILHLSHKMLPEIQGQYSAVK